MRSDSGYLLEFNDTGDGIMRGRGKTTRQLKKAEPNSLFVWVNDRTEYPNRILKELDRDDVKVVSPNWFNRPNWRGCKFSQVVIDHAAWDVLSDRQLSNLRPAINYFKLHRGES